MAEKEYIERKAAIEFVKNNTPNFNGWSTLKIVERAMKQAPSAEVAKVVRCKDCKYLEDKEWYAIHGHKIHENDFCSYGWKKERKKEEK